MKQKQILMLIVLLILARPAYAYLDPGTGSILLQSILAIIAAITAFIRIYWHKFKNLFKLKFKKINHEEKSEETNNKKHKTNHH